MKTIRLLLLFSLCFWMVSCKKHVLNNGNGQVPTLPKTYLKKIVFVNTFSSPEKYFNFFEYDSDGRLLKITSGQVGTPGDLDITFLYDTQNRLTETKDYGNALGPAVLQEIRRYYYDGSGNCIGDTAFDDQMNKTHYRDNSYTFDSQNRLLSKKHANGNLFRYEYGVGNNPVKSFMHFTGKPELDWTIYNSFDDKPTWLGASDALRLYYRVYSHKFAEDIFDNNPLEYKQTYSTLNGTSIVEYADVRDEIQYNSKGYPVKRKVTETSSQGIYTVFEQEFEYEEK